MPMPPPCVHKLGPVGPSGGQGEVPGCVSRQGPSQGVPRQPLKAKELRKSPFPLLGQLVGIAAPSIPTFTLLPAFRASGLTCQGHGLWLQASSGPLLRQTAPKGLETGGPSTHTPQAPRASPTPPQSHSPPHTEARNKQGELSRKVLAVDTAGRTSLASTQLICNCGNSHTPQTDSLQERGQFL